MKRRRHRHSQYVPLPVSDQRVRVPQFVRLFTRGAPDEVRFPNLAPLPVGSAWSAVALISPNQPNQTAGIIAQQAAGARAFGVGLREGCVVIDAATESRTTRLAPPMHQWSYIGVSASSDGARVYLGTGPNVSVEDVAGLAVARSAADAGMLIGHIGETFAGAIAFVCVFSDKLPDATMRSIAAGQLDPIFAPRLCFAWLTAAADQLDMVSRKMPIITGTKIIPFASAGGNVLYAPSAPNVPRSEPSAAPKATVGVVHQQVQAAPQQAPRPPPTPMPRVASRVETQRVESPRVAEPPIQRPPVEIPKAPTAGVRAPKQEPMPKSPIPPRVEEIPEIIDQAAASRSALFRELGLVDDPEKSK